MSASSAAQRYRLEQWLSNPGCQKNTASAVLNVSMHEVATTAAEKMAATGEQAPLVHPVVGPEAAFKLGRAFEANLIVGDPSPIESLLRGHGLIKPDQTLRIIQRSEGGTTKEYLDESQALLRRMSKAGANEVFVANGFRLPAHILPPESTFEVDLLLGTVDPTDDTKHVISIGEVKVYPAKGGRTDTGQISSARSQAGLYVQVIKDWLAEMADTENLIVDGSGFLVFSHPKDGSPVLISGESLSEQEQRARVATSGISRILQNNEIQSLLVDGNPVQKIEYVNSLPHEFSEGCWSHCSMAEFCFETVLKADRALALGAKTEQQLSSIALSRAVDLADGVIEPQGEVEQALVERFADATFDELEGLTWR